ncbi:MAG: DUF2029 domain-containing protein [Hyphomicrobiaceae bacterium]|nr:MAG: DUF2029 domain-containing protein [Hyphomicrobiaceae bacterium]
MPAELDLMPVPRRVLLTATLVACVTAAPVLVHNYLPAGWPLDVTQHAVGRDFINIWAAGRLLLEGSAATLFDVEGYVSALHRLFDPALQRHFWSYPPTSFLLALPFGAMPYGAALALWTIAGLAMFIAAARIALEPAAARSVLPLLIIAPATIINIICGQNGFLTAALLAAGFLLLERRPVLAGVFLGLLSYKPHLGIVVAPALVALGAWRAIAAATAAALALALASVIAFGLEPWRLFLTVTVPNQAVVLAAFEDGFRLMLVSPYGWFRQLGLPHGLAAGLQGAAALVTVTAVVWLVRSTKDSDIALGLVGLGAFIASPYALTYDLPIVALVIARLAVRNNGWTSGEDWLLGAAWAAPMLAIPFVLAGLPVAAPVLALAFAALCRRVICADTAQKHPIGPFIALWRRS